MQALAVKSLQFCLCQSGEICPKRPLKGPAKSLLLLETEQAGSSSHLDVLWDSSYRQWVAYKRFTPGAICSWPVSLGEA